jgi:Ring finger domain
MDWRHIKSNEIRSDQFSPSPVSFFSSSQRVMSQDSHGNWTLGTVIETNSTSDDPSSEATAPQSLPLPLPLMVNDDDNEEDHVCVICLDSFQVGDVVSWARFSEECHHVFHADCIGPWLQGKRQDDCPSCRHRIIVEEPRDIEEGGGGGVEQEKGDSEVCRTNTTAHVEEPVTDKEEDSFFMIARGLISRATKQAKQSNRYTLISSQSGSKSASSSTDEMDALMNNPLPQASPLRRVASHEPRPSPSTLVMGRRGANLTPTLASSTGAPLAFSSSPLSQLSINNFLPSSGSSSSIIGHVIHPQGSSLNDDHTTILPRSVFASNNVCLDDVPETLNAINPSTIMMDGGYSLDDTIFRRVQSDIGSSPTSTSSKASITNGTRRYPMMRSRTRAPSVLQGASNSVLTSSTTSDDDGNDDPVDNVVDAIFRQQPTAATPTTINGVCMDDRIDNGDEDEDEEDELQLIAPGALPASASRDASIKANKMRDAAGDWGSDAEEQV